MMSKLNCKPFGDFWQNCVLNNVFSIITSIEPSYKLAAYLNDYTYNVGGRAIDECTIVKYLDITYDSGLKKYIEEKLINKNVNYVDEEKIWCNIISINNYSIKDETEFLTEIEELIKNEKKILVSVDLYYWIPGGLLYENLHYNHYALITGYDDTNDIIYYTFDDDMFGYREQKISKERFVTAFSKATLKNPRAFEIIIDEKNLIPYKLNKDEIASSTEKILNDILKLPNDSFWEAYSQSGKFCEAIDNSIIRLTKIVDRQIGNKFLFESMNTFGVIKNDSLKSSLIKTTYELYEGWIEFRNTLKRCKYDGSNKFNIDKANGLDRMLLEKEHKMWSDLMRIL